MDTIRICPNCKKPLAADVPMGLCPECLMKAGFPTGTEGGPGQGFVPPPVEEIARLFPQLEILGLLGKGGMGAVYKARQPSLDRLVALKILPPTVANDPGFAERFNREARALARLNHPNIVTVHDFGQAGPLNFLLMELVDGPNLREMEQAGRLTPEQALAIVPQICEALQFAHGEGIVHRDIKPENILIDKKGRLKITDFGIAKIIGAPGEKVGLTGAQDVMGTPHYMAPEQIERPQTVDHRADIYSLGVVFYEMLTGELPLGKFQPPSHKVQMDVRLDEVVLRTLEKEPSRRYQQASEVKTGVETIVTTPRQRGTPLIPQPSGPPGTDKIIFPAFVLALFFGIFGAHRFYAGKLRSGLAQLGMLLAWIPIIVVIADTGGHFQPFLGLTLAAVVIGTFVWAAIGVILILCKAFTDGNGRRITCWFNPPAAQFQAPPPPRPKPQPAAPGLIDRNLIVAPAVALMVAGCFRVFSGLQAMLVMGAVSGLAGSILSALGLDAVGHLSVGIVFSSLLFKIVPGLLILFGAIELIQVRSYGWAMAAAILSIISCGVLSFVAGVWALIVLLLPTVRQTFDSPPASSPTADKWKMFLGVAAAVSLCLVLVSSLFLGLGSKTSNSPSRFFDLLDLLPDFGNSVESAMDDASDEPDLPAGTLVPAGIARDFSTDFPLLTNGTLTVKVDCGEVRIRPAADNTAKISVTRKVMRASDAEADRVLEEEKLRFRKSGSDLFITAVRPASLRHKGGWLRPKLNVHYDIFLPRDFAAHVTTLGGEINVTGLGGDVFAKTAGGSLKFTDVAGAIDGDTMGGNVTIENFTGSRVRAHTTGGSIDADFAAAPKADCDLHTMGGNVTAKIPESAAVNLDAHTMGGSVSSDLPVTTNGSRHNNSLQGRINDGGPVLKLETVGGNVELLRHL